jgi:Na+-transporting NADH:ubiquinone oxidoreductase subunit NqrC
MSPTVRARARRRYDRFAPILTLVLGVIGVAGIMVGASAMVANARQDAQRDADQSRILECFDTYTESQQTGGLAVREATETKDTAHTDAWLALGELTDAILAGEREEYAVTIAELNRRIEGIQLATQNLEDVREANPLPMPPSDICAE